ncbi:DEAD/DEAH box helicase [Aquifex sp.]
MFKLLKEEIREALKEIGFENPTPVQELTIPHALKGEDCLIQAKTGTGKTGAFGLPILNNLKRGERALILAPTRELAIQIRDNLRDFARKLNLRIFAFYGGTKVVKDLEVLKKPVDVIVGTPGRIRDLIERGALETQGIRYFVLDEVDLMLDMNFKEDIDFIYSHLPEDKQVFFVSATFPEEVRKLSQDYTKNPRYIKAPAKDVRPRIEEKILRVISVNEKLELLLELLRELKHKKVIIFVNRKKDTRFLEEVLRREGFEAYALFGDLPQRRREYILKQFRKGKIKILVATDVASRGLDIQEVEAVVNFHLPEDPKVYLHRIGRTGRMGRKGKAFSFVAPSEKRNLDRIKKLKRKREDNKNV